jgi:hypothetical protein
MCKPAVPEALMAVGAVVFPLTLLRLSMKMS